MPDRSGQRNGMGKLRVYGMTLPTVCNGKSHCCMIKILENRMWCVELSIDVKVVFGLNLFHFNLKLRG